MALSQLHGVAIAEFVEISAKFGQNIEELLETVLLVAEVEELKADPTVRAIGTVIEARLDKEVKVRLQPSLFNKVPCMFKTQSLLVIPSDVSVL